MTSPRRIGYLTKTSQERFRLRTNHSRLVNAWRVLDPGGIDIILPWFDTKAEAIRVCHELNIELIKSKP